MAVQSSHGKQDDEDEGKAINTEEDTGRRDDSPTKLAGINTQLMRGGKRQGPAERQPRG